MELLMQFFALDRNNVGVYNSVLSSPTSDEAIMEISICINGGKVKQNDCGSMLTV